MIPAPRSSPDPMIMGRAGIIRPAAGPARARARRVTVTAFNGFRVHRSETRRAPTVTVSHCGHSPRPPPGPGCRGPGCQTGFSYEVKQQL
eukprot:419262-Hanusia_phi.AAC.1